MLAIVAVFEIERVSLAADHFCDRGGNHMRQPPELESTDGTVGFFGLDDRPR